MSKNIVKHVRIRVDYTEIAIFSLDLSKILWFWATEQGYFG